MTDLMKFFQARKGAYHTSPRMIDDVLYTTYSYDTSTAPSQSRTLPPPPQDTAKVGNLLNAPDIPIGHAQSSDDVTRKRKDKKRFDAGGGKDAEIFLFQYGTVVVWGMTEAEEKRFLSSMYVYFVHPGLREAESMSRRRFEVERLGKFIMRPFHFISRF